MWLSYSSVLIGAYLLVVAGQLLNIVFHVNWNFPEQFFDALPMVIAGFWLLLFVVELCRVPQSDGSGEVIVNGRIVSW